MPLRADETKTATMLSAPSATFWTAVSYTHLYYVFQYATGISGANALARRVLSGGPGAAQDYLGFLKAGGSKYPLDALKSAGVDLATSQPVETAFGVLADLIERLSLIHI